MARPYRKLIQLARSLRKAQTPVEKLVWKIVQNRKLKGYKFLRQHPIPYKIESKRRFVIADFYCADRKLIVELDGLVHEPRKDYDKFRDSILQMEGYKVLRLPNETVANEERIMKILLYALETSPPSLE